MRRGGLGEELDVEFPILCLRKQFPHVLSAAKPYSLGLGGLHVCRSSSRPDWLLAACYPGVLHFLDRTNLLFFPMLSWTTLLRRKRCLEHERTHQDTRYNTHVHQQEESDQSSPETMNEDDPIHQQSASPEIESFNRGNCHNPVPRTLTSIE